MRFLSLSLLGVLLCGATCLAQTENGKLPPEFAAMQSALCHKAADFAETGCRVCPKFMTKDAEGRVQGGLGVYGVLFGSFTSVGQTEAFLNASGCFSHAEGFASAFLLRKENGVWRRLSYFHPVGPTGICQTIPGQAEKRDLLICNFEDYGAGAISVNGFDANGKMQKQTVLVQTWLYQGWRSLEKQKHCSSSDAKIKKVSFNSIEIEIFLNSFDVDPPINCFDENDSTTSKLSNARKMQDVAVFTRIGDDFAPDEKTKKLLAEFEKSH
jgi:hypothetical protein